MKMMKKVLALVMAMALVLGMAVTTFAKAPGNDGVYGTADDRGTITVNGITAEDELTVTAYQIVKAQYGTDGTGSFSGYVPLYGDVNVDETTGNITVDQDDLNNILSDIRAESPSVDPVSYTMLSDDETSYSADVPVGTYLVVIEGAETKVYNPVVVSVSYTVTEGDNDLEEGSVDVTDGSAWVKVSDTPTIDKTVSDSNETNVNGNSANVGETVTYNVTINSIPNYGGDYPVLKVVDTLSAGLTYANTNDDPLTVKVGDTVLSVGTDYTLNVEGQMITVDFVVNGEYTLNKYAGQSAVITYKAEVNEQAVVMLTVIIMM